jgi:hypothetical protein
MCEAGSENTPQTQKFQIAKTAPNKVKSSFPAAFLAAMGWL